MSVFKNRYSPKPCLNEVNSANADQLWFYVKNDDHVADDRSWVRFRLMSSSIPPPRTIGLRGGPTCAAGSSVREQILSVSVFSVCITPRTMIGSHHRQKTVSRWRVQVSITSRAWYVTGSIYLEASPENCREQLLFMRSILPALRPPSNRSFR